MAPLPAADELAVIRAQIDRLRRRERALCAALTEGPATSRQGKVARVEVVERLLRVFDHRLLPEAVRQDPDFWCTRRHVEVRCLPLRDGLSAGFPPLSAHETPGLPLQ